MHQYSIDYVPYRLVFNIPAGTSRGILEDKISYFIRVRDNLTGLVGYGEVSPLPNLSIDPLDEIPQEIQRVIELLSKENVLSSFEDILLLVKKLVSPMFPSVVFGFETALLDLYYGGKAKIIDNSFYDEQLPIKINGLVWMGTPSFMKEQIESKLNQGYSCIKMKIGAIDWEEEKKLLHYLRSHFTNEDLTLRVDANGAFDESNVHEVLDELAKLDIHSIEQPIKQGQWEVMSKLCENTPVPIALDEELIGIEEGRRGELLDEINPQYLIFKPSLIGGVLSTKNWIDHCERRNIKWWMTSALESNVGLNAIAQLTSKWADDLPQGLGTGQIYSNNICSPLEINKQYLKYGKSNWIHSQFV